MHLNKLSEKATKKSIDSKKVFKRLMVHQEEADGTRSPSVTCTMICTFRFQFSIRIYPFIAYNNRVRRL